MSDDVYTIPDYAALPANACHWPGCADPVCERDCPLDDDIIVACSRCGCAVGASTRRCPICDATPQLEACPQCGGERDHPALRWCPRCRRVAL